MFEAKNVMTKNVISVKKQTGIYEAMRTMVENNVAGLPVVDDNMGLAGVITEKDVLKLLYAVEDRPGCVEEFMSKDVISFDSEASLIDICECFINNSFRRVPIMSDGKVVGIISRKDVIAYILKLRHKDKAQPAASLN